MLDSLPLIYWKWNPPQKRQGIDHFTGTVNLCNVIRIKPMKLREWQGGAISKYFDQISAILLSLANFMISLG